MFYCHSRVSSSECIFSCIVFFSFFFSAHGPQNMEGVMVWPVHSRSGGTSFFLRIIPCSIGSLAKKRVGYMFCLNDDILE